jgi:hypothetical protein
MKTGLLRSGGLALLAMTPLAVAAQGEQLTDAEVERLRQACEARRQEKLEPIREQKTQACIEQQLRSPDHCKRYYQTYGNATAGPGRSIQQGYFYDLPECQRWLDARETLRLRRSRP